MSVVVALRDKKTGRFVLGGDSQTTYGSILYHGLEKIYKYEALNLTVGCVGDLRSINLLFNNEELFRPLIKNGKVDREYLVKDFTKKLFEYLKEYINDSIPKDDSGNEKSILFYSDIIIAYKNEAFHLFSNYSVLEVQNYDAVGIGNEASITCLEALDCFSNLSSTDIVSQTIKLVSKNISGIDPTIKIIQC